MSGCAAGSPDSLATTATFFSVAVLLTLLMLTEPYIVLIMGSAMAVAFAGLVVLRRVGRTRYAGGLALPHARVERRHVYGGAVFGVGFGLGATCPGMTVWP
jgi:uncharacterized protein